MKKNLVSLTAVAAVTALFVAAPAFACGERGPETSDATPAKGVKTVAVNVEGVDCANCTGKIHTALKKLDGIKAVREGSSKSQIVVEYVAEKVTAAQIIKAIKAAGFASKVA
jgi:copper chaperone CopZ